MILSIGMIVKNEEKYLRRCLCALKPLLDTIDSELIIADTGSEDKTVEIAKEFTDNVFYFEWCNDFSKARNSTLEKAKGEWFMFVDADEILQNPQILIDFFKSGEYKSYDCAKINIRNKKDDNIKDEKYADFHPTRLTKRTKDVKFCSPIHETLHNTGDRKKELDAVFLHYGYAAARKLYKKSNDYSKKILKELEKKPDNIRAYTQLIDAYLNIDLYKAILYSIKAINKSSESSVGLLYERLISSLCNAQDYVTAQKAADKYFSCYCEPKIININIYNHLINMYYKSGEYDKVITVYRDYKNIRNLVLSKKIILENDRPIYISDFYYIYNSITLMLSYIRTGKYDTAQNILYDIYKYPASAKSNITFIIIAVFELYEKTRNEQCFIEFIHFADIIGCFSQIDKIINSFLYSSIPCGKYIYDILKLIYEYDKNNKFHKFYDLLYQEKYITASSLKKDIRKAEELLQYIPDMLYFLLKYDCSLTDESIRIIKTKNTYITNTPFNDFSEILLKAVTAFKDTALIIPLCEQIFVFWEDISFEKRENIKRIYYNALSENIMNTVGNYITLDNCSLLPPVIRFRYLFKQLKDAETSKDYETVNTIKDILENIDFPINIFKK